MYLIIGDERDSCARAVRSSLERLRCSVITSPNPFGSVGRLRWNFDTRNSRLEYAFAGGPDNPGGALEGVFVRNFAAPQDTTGWAPEDLAYMRSEGMAALLAWLHALDCPVVGRLSDDAWFRPQRPLPEWVSVLAACGLPTPMVIVTNAPDAEHLAAGWSGRATYQPMTSLRSYAIHGAAWSELSKVMQHVPVCLSEPLEGPINWVTLAGEHLFWTSTLTHERERLEGGVRRVAARLESDFVQLNYRITPDGPKFTAVNLEPLLEVHDPSDQLGIADEIAQRLLGPEVSDLTRRTHQDAEMLS